MANSRRSLLIIPVFIVLSSAVGGRFGSHLMTASAASSEDDVRASVRNFTKIYGLVEENFADPVTADRGIYKGAIPGMLRTLDPHSNFFDPHDMANMRDDQRGHYYGIGMEVSTRNGKTVVIKPFAGSPAYKAGLRPGDVIAKVDGKSAENLTTTEVADMLKGPRGTTVHVNISREGVAELIAFDVVRDDITRASVDQAFWVSQGYGYIHIQQFMETTGHELDEALKKFSEDGEMKGLVLDLRGNPGGLLNEAVAVSDKFLNKGDVIVSHHGRSSPERVYRAQNGNHGHLYPIVVLVNRGSASASEIVSGALQDHDRGWIVGDNTFGKGLVQTVFPLSENTGLALTTAKYYTPSGRLIQRDYTNTSFLDYYYKTNTEARNNADMKTTDGGRTVYGGGGISPDEKIAPEKFDALQSYLYTQGTLNFTRHYFSAHSTKLPAGWKPDQTIVNDLHEWLLKQDVKFTEADFTKDNDWIKRTLGAEMMLTAFGSEVSDRYRVTTDPAVAKALEAMPKAQALLDSSKKIIVQRMAR